MLEDKRLVWKLERGDKEGLRRIYEKYKDHLLTIAISLLNDASAAEDILHDVFVSFGRRVGRFELRGNLRNYLVTCVVNRVRDRLRRKTYQVIELDRIGPVSSNSHGPEESAIENEESRRLADALAQLPYRQSEVIILHLQGGMKFREIANLQGISISTVQSRYRYGLEQLRTILDRELKK